MIHFLMFIFLNSPAKAQPDFVKDIQPIFNSRCIQCHSCYNSPCQLNLTSVEGLERGLIKDHKIYDSKRLRKLSLSRLGIDHKSTADWRSFGFESVLGTNHSILNTVIQHKKNNPSLALNDLSNFKEEQAENSRSCPDSLSALKGHLKDRPNAGMPYGLPELTDSEAEKVRNWTRAGSPLPKVSGSSRIESADQSTAKSLHSFLNNYTTETDKEQAKKQSLVSRFIFEHLFLAHIKLRSNKFYRLVRSKNTCDQIDEIASRRPWDDPKARFYYCLKKIDSTLVHKTHIVYTIDSAKVRRWNNLFLANNWKVSHKQGWIRWALGSKNWPADLAPRKDSIANNPFLIFKDIPAESRYQFLLDDAKYFVQTFIRGPVCKGNTAVNSIDEQFYVFFLKPSADPMVMSKDFVNDTAEMLHMPAKRGSEQTGFVRSVRFGKNLRKDRNQYRVLRDKYQGKLKPKGYSINDLWKGNDNAALTVMRHYNSASVVKGLVGATSKTIFVLDYSIFERLVYNLVVGFDVYGDVNHQLHTRIYMAYLRMEAEENFLQFIPSQARVPMRHFWYTDAGSKIEKIASRINSVLRRGQSKVSRRFPLQGINRPVQISYKPFDSSKFYQSDSEGQYESLRSIRRQFVTKAKTHLAGQIKRLPNLNRDKKITQSVTASTIGKIRRVSDFEREINKLTDLKGISAPWVTKLPSLSMVMIGNEIYTFVRNKEHYNVAWISSENGRRNLADDSLTVYKGIAGSYPNQIFNVSIRDASKFLKMMVQINSEQSYKKWIRKFGSPRSGPGSERFWANSDKLHKLFKAKYPVEYGVFDYNRMGVDFRFNNDGNRSDSFFSKLPKKLRKAAQSLVEGQ